MRFWSEHVALRMWLMIGLFVAGMAAILYGLSLSGQLSGLLIMLAGLGFLLAALWLYNKPFTETKKKH